MRETRKSRLTFQTGLAAGVGLSAVFILLVAASATQENQEISPTKAREQDAYFPNTEDLGPEEMRVIACGTGMPTTRAAQAAACFLVELGNGDKFRLHRQRKVGRGRRPAPHL